MTSNNWKKIEDIFQDALDCAPERRERFIEEKCAGDAQLRVEVEKLVARYEAEDDFLESPVWTDSGILQSTLKDKIAASLDEEIAAPREKESFVGRQIKVYQLTEELGRGGMGVVYLAERNDGEFSQQVAVKLIRRGMDSDFIVKRFRHERQILANFNHPHIARLLDGGTTEDGLPYFVMEYIEGKPFFKYFEANKLDLRARLRLFLAVCRAIAYAHDKKIIHRDIKPGNIIVGDDGAPKLLDFGIAKILDPDSIHESVMPTATQMRLMTPEYASPEQVRGDEITPASDQYSLGVLLYELVTGARPYKFPSRAPHEIARIICEEEPKNPSSADYLKTIDANDFVESRSNANSKSGDDFCGRLDRIILKTLRKNSSERYASINELSADIERLLANLPVRAENLEAEKEISEIVEPLAETKPEHKSIAVLPLQILNKIDGEDTGDGQYLSVGLADALVTRLSNVRQLIVRPTSSVLRYGESDADSFAAGRELNVEYILNGTILRANKRIRVSMQLLNVAKQSTIWAERFNEDFTDVLSLEDKISAKVAESLVPQLTKVEIEDLAKRGTENAKAYEAYLRGRYHWNTFTDEGSRQAVFYYRKAIEIDSRYALAYAGIADYYVRLGMYDTLPPREAYPPAKDAALRAVALDDKLSEAYAALGLVELYGGYDRAASERNMIRAIELNPNNSVAHLWYSHTLFTQRRPDKAIEHIRRAIELDPSSFLNQNSLAWGFYYARRYDEAVELNDELIKKYPSMSFAYFSQSWFLRGSGRIEESLSAAQKALELSGGSRFAVYGHAQALAAGGKRQAAEEAIRQIKAQAAEIYISYYHLAVIYFYLNEKEKMYEALEQAWRDREGVLIWIGISPALEALYDEPRFIALKEKIESISSFESPAEQISPVKHSVSGKFSIDKSSEAAPPDLARPPRTLEQNKITLSEAETIIQTNEPPRRTPAPFKYVLALIALIVLALGLYQFFTHLTFDFPSSPMRSGDSWRSNFASKMNVTRLTDSGQAQLAAVSPDGNQMVYVSKEDDRQALWIRETNAGDARQLVAPETVLIAGLTFSPDGQNIYYTAWSQNFIARNLYRVPAAGNSSPQLVLEQVNNGISFAPDGKRFAYVGYDQKSRQGFLQIAELAENGAVAATRTLATYAQPSFIRSNPSFAPDGKKICYIVGGAGEKKDSMNLYVFDLETNSQTKIGERSFGDVSGVIWRDGGEIIVSAAERDGLPYQLWAVAYPSGEDARLTNDFSSYFDLSIARDSAAMLTAKREKTSAVWLVNLDAPDNAKQLTDGSDRLDGLNGVSWTADNRILYVGGIGTQFTLMTTNADGTNNRALDVNAVRPSFPSLTKDKRYVVYADSQEKGSIVWRYDTTSGSLAQLTPNNVVAPTLTPDNRFVVYSSNGSARKISLHKIPLAGGDEIEITSALSVSPVVSPDGKWIACYYSGEETGNGWRITLLSAETGAVRRVIAPPETFNLQTPPERPLAWSPDGRWLYYLNDKNGVSNIFRIAAEGETPPEQITRFTSGRIFDFSLSPDGRQAALARGSSSSDVIIFKKFQ